VNSIPVGTLTTALERASPIETTNAALPAPAGASESNHEDRVVAGIYPLTLSQREIWFDRALPDQSRMHNTGGYVLIAGALDPERFEQAVNLLIRKHDCLRTMLLKGRGSDELPMQTFVADLAVRVPLHDFTQAADPHASALAWMQRRLDEPFSLYGEPLTRHDLLRAEAKVFYWLFQYHQIIVDGWSIDLLGHSLAQIYSALEKGEAPDLSSRSYVEFIKNDRSYVEDELFPHQRQYWLEKYRDLPDSLLKPRYPTGDEELVARSADCSVKMSRAGYGQLAALAKSSQATVFQVILAALYVYFVRAGAREELVVGLPLLNRTDAADRDTAGSFTSFSAARFSFGTDLSFTELVRSIARVLRQDSGYQRFPVSELNREIALQRTGRQQLFDVRFSHERLDHCTMFGMAPGRTTALLNSYCSTAMTIFVREFHGEEDVDLDLLYSREYFQTEEAEAIRRGLLCVFDTVIGETDIHVERIPLVTNYDISQLGQWNDTHRAYPQGSCIHELFEAQVERAPEALAVVCEEQSLSYGELNAQANRLARQLKDMGVGPEIRVAICAQRGIEMVVGVLATLKAGGAYVPLDPAYPSERLSYMLKDSGAAVLLHALLPTEVESRLRETAGAAAAAVDLRADVAQWARRSGQNLDCRHNDARSRSLAYVIYTSGSTGLPKGVMVEHRGLCNLAIAQASCIGIEENSRVLQCASFSFDACAFELVMSLCHGASLHVPASHAMRAGAELSQALRQHAITHVTLTPAVLKGLDELDGLAGVHTLVVAGEACTGELVRRWAPGRRLINA
jgi:non-ribosomal peptide synthetase component F